MPFFVVVLVLILTTWTCNTRLSGLIQCQCVIISHILLLYFILSETIHTVSTPANNNGPTPYQLFPMMMMSSLFRLFLRTPFLNFFYFLCHFSGKFFLWQCICEPFFRIFFVCLSKVWTFFVFVCHFSGKFFLWFFDRHENQVLCCTLLRRLPLRISWRKFD